jgi:hypothetical protein
MATEQGKALSDKARSEAVTWLQGMPQGRTENLNPVANDDEGNPLPPAMMQKQPTQQEMMAWALQGMAGGNPIAAQIASPFMAQALKANEPYTLREGDQRYGPGNTVVATNSKVRPLHFLDDGTSIQGVDQSTGQPIGPARPKQVTPDTQARLTQSQSQWEGLSANQRIQAEMEAARLGISVQQLMMDRARLANQSAETMFNTGSGAAVPTLNIPSIPQIPGAPTMGGMPAYGQPQAPRPAAPARTAPQAPQQPGPLVPPSMQGRITPKKAAELAAEQPGATQALATVNTNLDLLESAVDKVANGYERVTGPVAGRTWNLSGTATSQQALIDELKGKLGVAALQAMRDASRTGGAVGSVTEREWPILQGQIALLDQAQSSQQFKTQLDEIKATIGRMRNTAATAYKSTYGQPPRIAGSQRGSSGSWKVEREE